MKGPLRSIRKNTYTVTYSRCVQQSSIRCTVYLRYKMNPSPEIKNLIDKIGVTKGAATSQDKYEAILKRKCYDHNCFLECVCLRLDPRRGAEATGGVQTKADDLFTQMLSHTL